MNLLCLYSLDDVTHTHTQTPSQLSLLHFLLHSVHLSVWKNTTVPVYFTDVIKNPLVLNSVLVFLAVGWCLINSFYCKFGWISLSNYVFLNKISITVD